MGWGFDERVDSVIIQKTEDKVMDLRQKIEETQMKQLGEFNGNERKWRLSKGKIIEEK